MVSRFENCVLDVVSIDYHHSNEMLIRGRERRTPGKLDEWLMCALDNPKTEGESIALPALGTL